MATLKRRAPFARRSDQTAGAWRPAVQAGLGYFAAARLIGEVVALIAQHGTSAFAAVGNAPISAITIWQQWDSKFYLSIAAHGYTDNHLAAFPPLPSLLIGAVARTTHLDFAVAGIVVCSAAAALACVLLVRLVQLDYGLSTGRRTALLLLTFPTALFLLSVYAESLLLLFSVASFLAMRQGRTLLAGVMIACAALTKTYALVLVIPLVWDGIERQHWGRVQAIRSAVLLCVPPLLAVASWMLYLGHTFSDPLLVVTAERFWGRGVGPPWMSIIHSLRIVGGLHLVQTIDLLSLLLLISAAVYAWFRVRHSYAILLALSAMVFSSAPRTASPLLSTGRFAIAVFPLFIVVAVIGARRRWVVPVWLAILGPVSVYFVSGFVTNRFVG
jgi:hypothetical protein